MTFEGSTSFQSLAARLTKAGINRLGAEWRTDLQLGTDPALLTEFYQPLEFRLALVCCSTVCNCANRI